MATRVVERRIVTVLFADLVGFTSLSERLDAEDVSLIQDAYFDATEALVCARPLLARGERDGAVAESERALTELGVEGAPWWRAKAIRVLDETGSAAAALVEEARQIEARLRIEPSRS